MCRGCSTASFVQETTEVQHVYLSKVTLLREITQISDSRFGFLCLESEASQRCNRNSQTDQTGLVLKEETQTRSTGEEDAQGREQGY